MNIQDRRPENASVLRIRLVKHNPARYLFVRHFFFTMETFKTDKAKKLLQRLKVIVIILKNNPHLSLGDQVDQYTYLQLIEEIKTVIEQIEDIREKFRRLNDILDDRYEHCYRQWRRDVVQLSRMMSGDPEMRKTVL